MSEIKLKRSSVIESGSAKAPTAGQLTHGELALNFAESDPTIFYKDSNNDIREIKLALQPDLTIGTAQPGTLDDRYLRLSGGTLTGDLVGTSFQGGVVTISATAPSTNVQEGQLWYNTNDGRLYVYYTDADSSQWVDAAPDTLETDFTNADRTKLDGIEDGAQVNTVTSVNGQTGAVTVSGNTNLSYAPTTRELASSTGTSAILPEVVAGGNSGLMTGAAQTKLDGIETSATADQTGAEIKSLYELEANAFTDTLYTKLDAIETGATADQTGAEIKALYEAEADTNAFTDAEQTKLAGIEASATADQTGAEIKSLYEAEADTNAFTDAEQTKLAGIETGAQVNTVTSVNGQTGAVTVAGNTDLSYTASTRELASSTGNNAIIPEVVAAGDSGLMTGADKTKLDGIEASATADQTGAEIKAAYEAEADTNAFDDAAVAKLAGIEASATADQTGAEIKSLYEAESDTNAFTDAEQTKLAGIADSATNVTDNSQIANGAGYITSFDITTQTDPKYLRSDVSDSVADSAALSFGSTVRQMLNLYGTNYGLGVQSSTLYFRSDSRFSWHRDGSHNDNENNAGGGTTAMTLDGNSSLTVTGDVRAPIFYDSENTSYYLHPANYSVFYRGEYKGYNGSNSSGGNVSLEIENNGGTGDGGVAAMAFHCSGHYAMHMHLRHDSYFGIGGWSASTWRWYVRMNTGDMTAAGNVTAYSDIRLKEEIEPLQGSLDKLLGLNGVSFRWKDLPDVVGHPGQKDFGIIAQEVEQVFPEVIHESPHESPEGDAYKTVAYDKLVPVLIEAIKELKAEIENLKAGGY